MKLTNLSRILFTVALLNVFVFAPSCAEADEADKTEDIIPDEDDSTEDNSSSIEPAEPLNSYTVSSKAEFDEAVKKVVPGDEIVLANGTYTDIEFEFDADGEEGNLIYLRGEDPSQVFISGSSQIKFGGDYLYVYNLSFNGCVATTSSSKGTIVEFRNGSSNEAYHCTLSDCHFDACVPEDKSFDDVWVNVYGQYNTIQRCYFGDKDNKGLYIVVWHKDAKADYCTIRENYFYRPISYNSEENGQEIIRIGDSTNSTTDSSTLVEDNFFYQCNGEVEIISIKSGDNTINRNTFLECVGCVTLRHGNYNTVSNNYLIANNISKAGGVRIINKGHKIYNNYFYGHITDDTRAPISIQLGVLDGELNEYDPVSDVTIANNTMIGCKQNFSFGVSGTNTTVPPTDVLITGHIAVTDQTSTLIDDNGTDTSGITFSDSYLEGKSGVISGDGLLSSCDYTETTMTIAGTTFPKLVATTTYDSAPEYVTEDISGIERTSPTPIGAIADAASAPAATIADNTNCGPNWSGWYKPL
ncbi:MAG: polysaccharide lyase 6 family protein [Rikenellaceae bacterium]